MSVWVMLAGLLMLSNHCERGRAREREKGEQRALIHPPTPDKQHFSLLRTYPYVVACSSASNAGGGGGGGGGGDTHKFGSITSHPALRRKTELFVSVESMAGHDCAAVRSALVVSPVSGGKWKVTRARRHILKSVLTASVCFCFFTGAIFSPLFTASPQTHAGSSASRWNSSCFVGPLSHVFWKGHKTRRVVATLGEASRAQHDITKG